MARGQRTQWFLLHADVPTRAQRAAERSEKLKGERKLPSLDKQWENKLGGKEEKEFGCSTPPETDL